MKMDLQSPLFYRAGERKSSNGSKTFCENTPTDAKPPIILLPLIYFSNFLFSTSCNMFIC